MDVAKLIADAEVAFAALKVVTAGGHGHGEIIALGKALIALGQDVFSLIPSPTAASVAALAD